jgi:predicted transcriptional regulator
MSLRLDATVRERLSDIAKQQKRSTNALALEAIKVYVLQKEAETKWNQEAVASWNDYQETGLHITHDELDTWLSTWGTPDEQPMPKCHI